MDENFGKHCWNFAEISCFGEGQYKKREEISEKIDENCLRHQNIAKKNVDFLGCWLVKQKGKILAAAGVGLEPETSVHSLLTSHHWANLSFNIWCALEEYILR